nr:hypothetical protein [Nocardia nova]
MGDEVARRADRHLDVGRGKVLARSGDDQFLLAVDDPDEPVVIDARDVTGMQPALGVEGLAGAGGLIAVAAHDLRSTHQQFTIGRRRHLHRVQSPADAARS